MLIIIILHSLLQSQLETLWVEGVDGMPDGLLHNSTKKALRIWCRGCRFNLETNQRLGKTAVRTLLTSLGKKSLDLLSEYEQNKKFPNQTELTTSLMTLEPDKGQTISLQRC